MLNIRKVFTIFDFKRWVCAKTPIIANWSEIISEIELIDGLPIESLEGIETFSHLEIIYFLDKSNKINSPSDGVKVAMIEHNGAPIELIEFD